MIDCHVHSTMSGDCSAPMLDTCKAAVDAGLSVICFTEHLDFEPTDSCYQKLDYDTYLSEINAARKIFNDRLEILFGIEVDFQVKYAGEINKFLSEKSFDYILGAVHYVDGVILENHETYFPGKTAEEAYTPYFENTLAAVRTGWFDALAHIDLCKRYGVRYFGKFDYTPFAERISQILSLIIEKNMSLEVNTSGLRQSPAETYPGIDILKLYHSMGGQNIVMGSDSHRSVDVGKGIDNAIGLAQSVGFDQVCIYRKRERISNNLII